eukprot:jgi/Tetstr1/441634/TSEL_029860.t1
MVEGHQCHRVAHHHRKILQGMRFQATSPNGRFTEGAKAIDGKPLEKIEVVGKNLFYFFGSSATDTTVLHFHFGMSGAFKTYDLPGREPTPTTRLQLVNQEAKLMAHLSAMTVQHGGIGLYEEKFASLGPDPLREDADKERFWSKVVNTKKPIGLLLMDQSCIAGVGNIYRAEILFQARLHPEQPANTVSRDKFEEVWRYSVTDLQRGFKSGSILTVTPQDAKRLGTPWTRRGCQPLQEGSVLATARTKALAAASPTKVFKSHCAPEGPETQAAAKMTVAELRARLAALGLSTTGKKEELVKRLDVHVASAVKAEKAPAHASLAQLKVAQLRALLAEAGLPTAGKKAELVARLQAQEPKPDHKPEPPTGTAIVGEVASAEEAAQEKERAGENRAVEHVALVDQRPSAAKGAAGKSERLAAAYIPNSFRAKKPRRAGGGGDKK